MTPKDQARFWAKIKVNVETGCWEWTGAIRLWNRKPGDGGYGAFWMGGRVVRAHKAMYELLVGPVPRGKILLHECDNRRCVNVAAHIAPGTHLQNMKDMVKKGRS